MFRSISYCALILTSSVGAALWALDAESLKAQAPPPSQDVRATVTNRVVAMSNAECGNARWILPVVAAPNASATAAMRRALSVNALFGQTETELRRAFAEDCAGVTSASYMVTYNRSGLLGLTVSADTMGAYSDSSAIFLTFALASGRSVGLDELLTPAGKRRVLAQFSERIRTRVTQLEATVEAEGGDSHGDFHELLNSIEPSISYFSVTEAGILLVHDFDFPHYMLASEPDGSVVFTWAQLGNALAPAGLLADRRQ